MSKFEELRSKFDTFYYKDYTIEMENGVCNVTYSFEIPGLCRFHPTWQFPVKRDVNMDILRRLVFSLGMVECISYYKCVCSKKIVIECGSLSEEQKAWWKKLFYNGLGEFMYLNQIKISQEDLFEFECEVKEAVPFHDEASYEGCLIPVGGGKDSVVSLEVLKDQKVVTYHINNSDAIQAVIDVYDEKEYDYCAKRTLDRNMLELNKQGFLNGHTPFSALVAFSTIITSYLIGTSYVMLSNENSANESTVKDSFVNHQYSKSYEFEQDFEWYVKTMTDSDIHYFSFLRPLTEIQIASLFARFTKYHKIFRSCNVGSKKGIWCCDCPKCLFVYIIMLPFLTEEQLVDMFGENLLNKPSLEEDFKKLAGILEDKPFECVGTRREVVVSLKHFIANGGKSLLTDKYKSILEQVEENLEELLAEWNDENMVPESYLAILKGNMKHE